MNPEKKRLYLLHGLMGTAESHFVHVLEGMSEWFEVIPLDLPGHGNNKVDASTPYFEAAVQWLIEEITDRGKGCCIALSLGASLVLHSALRKPEIYEAIIVSGYTPHIPESMEGTMRRQYDYLMNIQNHDPKLASRFREMHGERWFNTLTSVLEDFTFNYPVFTDSMIKELKVPTLILNGANEKHERDAANQFADLNPKISAGLIPSAGQMVNAVRPEIYNHLALSYFRSTLDQPNQTVE
ncbi:alpha/beta fold hydrolase [Paenibacillus senegalensis]|uniref:alpha/beta fold hydrolase n=1 Tax=Paenibacillus senegalensis TaxID=1465766 RepID=UPI000289C39E|nr:alpha/beta fold hydrolase [Paenibacillus senegalensis]